MSFSFESIDAQRRVAEPSVIVLIWLMVPVLGGVGWWQQTGAMNCIIGAAACALLATGAWQLIGSNILGRSLSGIALMAQISVLVANGGSWQVDFHMAYFAALALLIVYSDWAVILVAAGTVAVHHLVMSYVIPCAIFPGSVNLDRIVLHAVILTVEAGVLIWVTANLNTMFATASRSLVIAETAVRDAQASADTASEAHAVQKRAQDRLATAQSETSHEERLMVVDSIGAAVKSLAHGDLTHRIQQQLPHEYSAMRDEFNDAISHLKETVMQMAEISGTVRSGTSEISSAADDLSRRTEQQAASLEETVAALDRITLTVRKTAEGALHARQIVGTAKIDAEHSGQIVRRAVDAMGAIEKSSGEIGQIIGVINEIAFQTNLLALNAGVEAARAGDAGRGFAVVASEVRALAQRSAEAAKEIKALVSASSHHVEQGVDLVGRTGSALERIVGQVTDVDTIINEIAVSAQEQATGLGHVNTAMTEMDQMTQQNAAMVEESTAASHALTHESEELARLISRFEIGAQKASPSVLPIRKSPVSTRTTASAPLAGLKVMGRGGPARKAEPDSANWQEF